MAHDVFVCHPSEERATAMAVVATLEADRVRCWIAPRDVLPSEDWAEAIVRAIKTSRLFVLVFSEHSNQSKHVMREVEQAVSRGIPILPFRIADVEPNPTLEYFIGGTHWLDALTPPLEAHLHRLAETVSVLLPRTPEPPTVEETGTTDSERPVEPPEVAQDEPAGSDAEAEPPITDDWHIEVQPLTDDQVKSLLDSKEQAVLKEPDGIVAEPVDDADEEHGQVAAAVPPPAEPPPEPLAVPPATSDVAGISQPPVPEERIGDRDRQERKRRGPLLAVGAAAILIVGSLGVLGLTQLLGDHDTEVLNASVTTTPKPEIDESSIPVLDTTTTTSTSPPTTTTSSAPPSTTTTSSKTTTTAPPATTAPKPTTPTTVAVALVARNDSYTKDDRSQTCFDVTANDSGSAPLTVVSVGGSEFGSASAASCGVVYSPPDFDTRPDAFVDVISYTVKDATGATASAILTVSVR